MNPIEIKIKNALRASGIECQSVYAMPDAEESRILLAFKSKDSGRLTTRRIERTLNNLGIGSFKVPKEFHRLSASFLHLEVILGARTSPIPTRDAL